jgi:hypothetical protein
MTGGGLTWHKMKNNGRIVILAEAGIVRLAIIIEYGVGIGFYEEHAPRYDEPPMALVGCRGRVRMRMLSQIEPSSPSW